jgi:dephospho-CoA kinase
LNAIVHPAVINAQAEQIAALAKSHTILVIESALIFSVQTETGGKPWRERFDRILLVTAPEAQKIARFIGRAAAGRVLSSSRAQRAGADALRRLRDPAPGRRTRRRVPRPLERQRASRSSARQVDAAWQELLQLEKAHRTE